MSDSVCLLITLTSSNQLIKCALKLKKSQLKFDGILDNPDDMLDHPMAYRKLYERFLPLHVSNFGNIVEIERIFEIVEVK